MNTISLYPGDNRDSLRRLIESGTQFDSIVTDPPYAYDSIVKRNGAKNSAPVQYGSDGAFKRLSTPFMGKTWDATGIEKDPEFWKLLYDTLKPGGFVFAFSSPRTGHRQATAMESAGFILHPFFVWANGQGMPKGHDAAKMIDKHLGVKGETVDGVYQPVSEEALKWMGRKYGTQSQKPVLEPIYLAQKPFSEKNGPANFIKHGVGAFDIDGCRVPADDGRPLRVGDYKVTEVNTYSGRMDGTLAGGSKAAGSTTLGRYPSNLILDGSPEVVSMFPSSAGARAPVRGTEPSDVTNGIYGKFNGRVPGTFYADEGSAARFFHQFPLTDEDYSFTIDAGIISVVSADPLVYHPKANKADRAGSKHPTIKPIALMQYLIRHITPPGGVVLDPFAGSGGTAEAARREGFDCVLMEAEPEYVEFIKQRFPEINLPEKELGGLEDSSFSLCSHRETGGGPRFHKTDLSDLIGNTVDISDLI